MNKRQTFVFLLNWKQKSAACAMLTPLSLQKTRTASFELDCAKIFYYVREKRSHCVAHGFMQHRAAFEMVLHFNG